jgi:hypothetical protein
MPKIQYVEHNLRASSLRQIEQANEIIDEYKRMGYGLSLRQLFYQFVSRDLIANTEQTYHNLGVLLTKAREAGLVDWNAIEDRGRGVNEWLIEEDETEPLRGIEYGIAYDYWERQGKYIEVWVEKDALTAVVKNAAMQYNVPYMACKGYLSSSEAWSAGRRFKKMAEAGRECIVFHLGDHDPRGLHMTEDNRDRLDMFSEHGVSLRRLGLSMEQIEQYNPPPNPAKQTDKMFDAYVDEHGPSCWELDALSPKVIEALVTKAIKDEIDEDVWAEVEEQESEARKYLQALAPNWQTIKGWIGRDILGRDEDNDEQEEY